VKTVNRHGNRLVE